ncbi:MAG: ribose 5-phosphate isomerase B [Rhodothermales bacterium]
MAKKKLITEAHVRRALQAGQQTLTLEQNTLITPLAQDTAREHGLIFATAIPDVPSSSEPSKSPTHVVAIGSDHGGFHYKETLKPLIAERGWRLFDVGTDTDKSCDYPDYAFAVARAVALGKADFGVMIDGAGLGSAMVCNKVPGIRAACAYNEFTAWNARAHNNAQVLTLGSRTLGIEVCKRIVETFLATPFEGGRHNRRVDKIGDVEARFLPGSVE